MKLKLLLLRILILVTSLTLVVQDSQSQSTVPWAGLGSFGPTSIVGFVTPNLAFTEYGPKIQRITANRKDYNTAAGVYNWTPLFNTIQTFANAGIYMQIEMFSGDLNPQYVFDTYGYFNTTGGNRNGPWPKYMTTGYRDDWFRWNRDLQAYIVNLPYQYRKWIACMLIDFGSTGDLSPYKGTPVSMTYAISDNQWDTESKRYWDSIVAVNVRLHADTIYALGFNPNNTFYYNKYLYERYSYLPKLPWMKQGGKSHFYNLDGAGISIGGGDSTFFGETQYPIPGNLVHIRKEGRSLVWQAIATNFLSLQINPRWRSEMKESGDVISSPAISNPVNTYMQTTNRGFSVPSGQIIFDDLTQYPEGTYGPLIAPASLSTYNTAVTNINADAFNDDRSKLMLRLNKVRQYINYARINALKADLVDAQYDTVSNTTDPNYHMWNNDFVLTGILNYEKNITLLDPYGTTVNSRRIGPDTSLWGRGGFHIKPSMEAAYNIADSLKASGSNKLQFTVWYLDGTGSFSVNCTRCTRLYKQTITGTNSGQVKSVTVTVDKFKFYTGITKDMWMKDETGSTEFLGLEIYNSSKH